MLDFCRENGFGSIYCGEWRPAGGAAGGARPPKDTV